MMATAMATTTTKAHDHPPYKEMIVSAIESLKERKGSSKTAIAKCIASKYNDLPPTHNALLATHLRRLKQKGTVQMIKHSYKLVGLSDTNSGPKKRGRPAKKLKPDNAVVGPPEKKKPGRPKKVVGEEKRRAGRPKKESGSVIEPSLPRNSKTKLKPRAGRPRKESASVVEPSLPRNSKAKLKPGRPKKSNTPDVAVSGEKRKPGRPKKVSGVVENGSGSKLGENRKPGRPKKAAKGEGSPLGGTKRRGRPPKGGMPAVAAKTGPEVKRSVGRPKKNVEA